MAGKPNKTIAFDLGISPRTVEIYRANLMTKMAANSLSDLVRMAMMAGIPDGGGDRTRATPCYPRQTISTRRRVLDPLHA